MQELNLNDEKRDPISVAMDKLHSAISTTTMAKFIAERRLRWHDRFTQTTLMFNAIALIALSIGSFSTSRMYFNSELVKFIEILMAVFILALGLLLGQSRFEVRANEMSKCARKLLHLKRHLDLVRHRKCTEGEYLEFSVKYNQILENSEAHRPIDYSFVKLKQKSLHYKDRTFLDRKSVV